MPRGGNKGSREREINNAASSSDESSAAFPGLKLLCAMLVERGRERGSLTYFSSFVPGNSVSCKNVMERGIINCRIWRFLGSPARFVVPEENVKASLDAMSC